MILKKPYAFLIKYFRIIHLVLTVLMGYILYKTYNITNVLDQSINNNYTSVITGEMAGTYINYFMYLGVIIIIGLLVAIYYLLSHKDKPRKYYIVSIIYYIIIFILLSIFYDFLSKMAETNLTSATLRAYRDVSLLAMIPQIFFIIYAAVSAIGFNIKKFDFEKDLKELEIEAEDNEEFEITFGKNNYKTKRNIRRTIREFKYYILENKFVFTIILIVTAIILATTYFINREVYNKDYGMDDLISHNSFSISILDSIISPYAYNGEIIKEGKYYVAVKIAITNNSSTNKKLDYTNFRISIGEKTIKPILEKSQYFMDFAEPYMGKEIKKETSKTISLVYEIDKSDIQENYNYKIYRGSEINPGEIISRYSELTISPVLINEIADSNEVDLKERLDFIYSNIGDSYIKIKDYQLSKNYQYSFEKCDSNNNCKTLNDAVAIDYTIIGDYNMLIAFDYDWKLDKECLYYNSYNSIKDFVTNFMTIRYTKDGQTYTANVKYRDVKNLSGKFIVQTTDEISDADSVSAVFTIRNKRYITKLK